MLNLKLGTSAKSLKTQMEEDFANTKLIVKNNPLMKIIKIAIPAMPDLKDTKLFKPKPASTQGMVVLDSDQRKIYDKFLAGYNFVIHGGAGVGKTYLMGLALIEKIKRGGLKAWGCADPLVYLEGVDEEHGHITRGFPGVVTISFTNRAVSTFARNVEQEILFEYEYMDGNTGKVAKAERVVNLADACMTIHTLLQYMPVKTQKMGADAVAGSTTQFKPTRTADAPFCPNLVCFVFEEASMVSISPLFVQVVRACNEQKVQMVLLGDLWQLLPVAGQSLLGIACKILPVHTLETVYRHAGAIFDFATHIRNQTLPYADYSKGVTNTSGGSTTSVIGLPKNLYGDPKGTYKWACTTIKQLFIKGLYLPGLDQIIIPARSGQFNGVAFMETLLEHLDALLPRPRHLLVAGSSQIVVSVGDTIMVQKKPMMILRIDPNLEYKGTTPQQGAMFTTRNPEAWELVYDSYIKDNENSVEFMSRELDAGTVDLESALRTEIEDQERVDKESGSSNKRLRQASHELLMLDLDSLPGTIGRLGYDTKVTNKIMYALCRHLIKLAASVASEEHQRPPGKSIVDLQQEMILNVGFTFGSMGLGNWFTQNISVGGISDKFKDVQHSWQTAYQAQGGQHRTVIFAASPQIRSNLLSCEAVYTAVTRAQEYLIALCHEEVFNGKGPNNPAYGVFNSELPGQSVEEKVANLMFKLSDRNARQAKMLEDIAIQQRRRDRAAKNGIIENDFVDNDQMISDKLDKAIGDEEYTMSTLQGLAQDNRVLDEANEAKKVKHGKSNNT